MTDPCTDLALVPGHQGGDVIFHHVGQRILVGDGAHPRGQLRVPYLGDGQFGFPSSVS